MKKHKIFLFLLPIIALFLESLPNSIILVFRASGGVRIRRPFSFFSMVSIGYGLFAPLITLILTLALIIMALIYLFKDFSDDEKNFRVYISGTSILAFLFSLVPLLINEIAEDSLIGILVCATLFLEYVIVRIARFMIKN